MDEGDEKNAFDTRIEMTGRNGWCGFVRRNEKWIIVEHNCERDFVRILCAVSTELETSQFRWTPVFEETSTENEQDDVGAEHGCAIT